MTRLAWAVAVFAVVACFIFTHWAGETSRADQADAARRLEQQRQRLELMVDEVQRSLATMKANYQAFVTTGAELEQQHGEVARSWQELEQNMAASDQALERLHSDRATVKDDKARRLDEIKELQRQIGDLERQVQALQPMLAMVKPATAEE